MRNSNYFHHSLISSILDTSNIHVYLYLSVVVHLYLYNLYVCEFTYVCIDTHVYKCTCVHINSCVYMCVYNADSSIAKLYATT